MNGEIRGPGGTCLEVPQGQTHDGANAQLGACNRSSGQFWEVTSSGEIRGPGKKCLDVSGARTDDQTNIQLYTCNGTRAQRFKLVGPGYLATTQLAQNPQVPEAPSPEQPQEPLEDPNTPLPPQTIQAPNERPCLHWQVVEQKVCEPTLRCEYQGGTCQTTKNCRREPFRKSFTRRSCWKRPHLVYQTQRVCSPRMVTSKTVVCRDERFFTTSTRPDCGYQMVVDYVPKQVCDKTNCLQQQQCTNTPQRKCERRPVRKLVSECRDVPVRITKPQRVCNTVRQKKLVPKRVCPPSRGPQCQMQNVCTTVNERRCAPVRRTYVEMKCRTVTTYQMRTQQQCQNVPVRQTRYRQVCQQGPQRCTTQTNCPNSGNNSYCTNRHGDPRCRGCRSSRRCTPGQRICRNVPQTVTTFQRRCTTRTVRVPLPKQLCQKIPRVTTTQQCSVVPQRRCQTKRVCRPSGPSVCRTEMVAEYRDVQQCRMVTRPGVIQQRQCRNVQKTVVEEVCRMVGGRNCRTVTNCPTGPRRCRKKLVPVQAKRWVCKKMKIVRQPHVRRICRQQTVRRQLTQCRMERRVTRELRRHCEERRFFALVHRWRCDRGIDCTPGREVCNEVPVCRTRYDQVCAAW